jgi:hypothetical protein
LKINSVTSNTLFMVLKKKTITSVLSVWTFKTAIILDINILWLHVSFNIKMGYYCEITIIRGILIFVDIVVHLKHEN